MVGGPRKRKRILPVLLETLSEIHPDGRYIDSKCWKVIDSV